MKRRTYLKLVGAGTGSAAFTSTTGAETTTTDLPRLHTEGNALVDEDGERVTLRGVNVPDPSVVADEREPTIAELVTGLADEDAGWYTDIVRIPVHRWAYRWDPEAYVRDYLDPTVDACERAGLYCIVEYHRIEDYDGAEIDEQVRAFWDHVAPRYADRSHVFYQLINEPMGPMEGEEDWTTWKEVAQPWVDLVRSHAPENPIIVGSPRWNQFTRFAVDDPFRGENLLYAGHIYPNIGRDRWENMFGEPAEHVPVFVTEWGYQNTDEEHHYTSTTSEFGEPLREFLDSHPTVNWTAWTYDWEWEPSMVDENYTLLGGDDMGEFAYDWLAETANDSDDTSGGDGTGPVLEEFTLQDRSNPAWTRYGVDWAVSDADGDLSVVTTELLDDGRVRDSESSSTAGRADSGTHELRTKKGASGVVVTVQDEDGNVASASRDL